MHHRGGACGGGPARGHSARGNVRRAATPHHRRPCGWRRPAACESARALVALERRGEAARDDTCRGVAQVRRGLRAHLTGRRARRVADGAVRRDQLESGRRAAGGGPAGGGGGGRRRAAEGRRRRRRAADGGGGGGAADGAAALQAVCSWVERCALGSERCAGGARARPGRTSARGHRQSCRVRVGVRRGSAGGEARARPVGQAHERVRRGGGGRGGGRGGGCGGGRGGGRQSGRRRRHGVSVKAAGRRLGGLWCGSAGL